jgi:hypothetical protein
MHLQIYLHSPQHYDFVRGQMKIKPQILGLINLNHEVTSPHL